MRVKLHDAGSIVDEAIANTALRQFVIRNVKNGDVVGDDDIMGCLSSMIGTIAFVFEDKAKLVEELKAYHKRAGLIIGEIKAETINLKKRRAGDRSYVIDGGRVAAMEAISDMILKIARLFCVEDEIESYLAEEMARYEDESSFVFVEDRSGIHGVLEDSSSVERDSASTIGGVVKALRELVKASGF